MNYYKQRRKSSIYWHYFLITITLTACIVKIWNTQQEAAELWVNHLFSFLYAKEYIYKGATSILLVVNTFSVILFLRRFSFSEFRNYYPAVLYLLFCFIFADTLTLWGMLIGTFSLWGIFPHLFGLKEDNIYTGTFMYGLSCGILSLIYTPFLLLLLFLYIALFRERYYTIRAFILPIVGVCLAYVYVFAGFYLLDSTDKIPETLDMIKAQTFGVRFSIGVEHGASFIFFLIASVSLACISLFQIGRKVQSFTVNKRKNYVLLLLIAFLQSIFTLFFHAPYHLLSQTMIILFVVLLSISMLFMKKAIVYKLIFLILFVIAFYAHFL